MRLKRTQNDFRVTELLEDDQLGGDGAFAMYRVTKRGLTTFEAADVLAKGAGVERGAVTYAGLKDKDYTYVDVEIELDGTKEKDAERNFGTLL